MQAGGRVDQQNAGGVVDVVHLGARCVLIDTVGLDTVLERVPDNYLRAMFASYVASRFVYRYGLESNEVDFVNFIQRWDDAGSDAV